MRIDLFSDRHHWQRIASDTDETEFAALKDGAAPINQGLYDDLVAGSVDDFIADDALPEGEAAPEWERLDIQQDTAEGAVRETIEQRLQMLGDAYPFTIEDGRIVYKASASLVYEFCLVATQVDIRQRKAVPRDFERLAARLSQAWIGPYGRCRHIGWPRTGQKSYFHQAVGEIQGAAGQYEWHFQPAPGLPSRPSPASVKDGGVDFVSWVHHPDDRSGHLYLLGQCACGSNWENKWSDINLRSFSGWFNPLSWVNPVSVFCTPFHVTDGNLMEASKAAGLVFDRIRLTLLAHRGDQELLKDLTTLDLRRHIP